MNLIENKIVLISYYPTKEDGLATVKIIPSFLSRMFGEKTRIVKYKELSEKWKFGNKGIVWYDYETGTRHYPLPWLDDLITATVWQRQDLRKNLVKTTK